MNPEADPRDLKAAIGAIAEALARHRLLQATARLETVVSGAEGFELLNRAEAALAAAWPEPTCPVHELVWALPNAGGGPSFALSAYDERGRLLLRRRFAGGGEGGAHV